MSLTQTLPMTDEPIAKRVEPMDITVLAGGPGVEREVSLESGQAVADALRRLGHRVLLNDIGPDDLSALDQPADFVFVALHGEFGEDGTIQAHLDGRKLPYSGSGSSASRLAMDKVQAKRRLQRVEIPTPAFEVVDRNGLTRLTSRFPLPAVVKPTASGSSVDTTIVHDRDHLMRDTSQVIERHGHALIESYVQGPELTVAVLGDEALPVCEIRTRREFYDYDAKYNDHDTQYLFDLDLPSELLSRVRQMSLKAHRALGCEVFSRVDWMVDARTLEPFFLEVNTIPGFTSHSLVPKSAARIGMDFDRLCQRIVELSQVKHQPPSGLNHTIH